MVCNNCGSHNVTISNEVVTMKSRTNNTSIARKIGRLFLILCTLGTWLLVPKRKSHTKTAYDMKTIAVCQNCGNSWEVK